MVRREWTEQEIAYIDKFYEKRGVPYLAAKLNRTETSVKRKAQSLGHNAYAPEDLYVRTIARCFNSDPRVVSRWIRKFGLPHYCVQRGKTLCRLVEVKKFWTWAENHKDIIPWHKYERLSILPEPEWLRETVRSYSTKNTRTKISPLEIAFVVSRHKKGYSYKEIAASLQRTENSAKHIWRNYRIKRLEGLPVSEQKVGNIVERLIAIRDEFRRKMTREEQEALANACNILSHSFNYFDTAKSLVEENVTNIAWRVEDIKNALDKLGFDDCEKNVKTVLTSDSFIKNLEDNSIDCGWDFIENIILLNKDELIPYEEPEDFSNQNIEKEGADNDTAT